VLCVLMGGGGGGDRRGGGGDDGGVGRAGSGRIQRIWGGVRDGSRCGYLMSFGQR
jgi:hypothetical protein